MHLKNGKIFLEYYSYLFVVQLLNQINDVY